MVEGLERFGKLCVPLENPGYAPGLKTAKNLVDSRKN